MVNTPVGLGCRLHLQPNSSPCGLKIFRAVAGATLLLHQQIFLAFLLIADFGFMLQLKPCFSCVFWSPRSRCTLHVQQTRIIVIVLPLNCAATQENLASCTPVLVPVLREPIIQILNSLRIQNQEMFRKNEVARESKTGNWLFAPVESLTTEPKKIGQTG